MRQNQYAEPSIKHELLLAHRNHQANVVAIHLRHYTSALEGIQSRITTFTEQLGKMAHGCAVVTKLAQKHCDSINVPFGKPRPAVTSISTVHQAAGPSDLRCAEDKSFSSQTKRLRRQRPSKSQRRRLLRSATAGGSGTDRPFGLNKKRTISAPASRLVTHPANQHPDNLSGGCVQQTTIAQLSPSTAQMFTTDGQFVVPTSFLSVSSAPFKMPAQKVFAIE